MNSHSSPDDAQNVAEQAVGGATNAMSADSYKLSDEAREAAIKHAGNLVVKFANAGKRVNAMHALTMMHALIAGRSPEWIAKRTAQAAAMSDEGCYFAEQGERDRARLTSTENPE